MLTDAGLETDALVAERASLVLEDAENLTGEALASPLGDDVHPPDLGCLGVEAADAAARDVHRADEKSAVRRLEV